MNGKITISIISVFLMIGLSGCISNNDSSESSEIEIISFKADPNNITKQGEQINLSWEVTNATTVTINNKVGEVDLVGSITLQPFETMTYILTASNDEESKTANARIVVPLFVNYNIGIIFKINDSEFINTLTVEDIDEEFLNEIGTDLLWDDIEMTIGDVPKDHGMSGIVAIGDIINISKIAGIGSYDIVFTYIPFARYSPTLRFSGSVTLGIYCDGDYSTFILEVSNVEPIGLLWEDIGLYLDSELLDHGLSGPITIGDSINIDMIYGPTTESVTFIYELGNLTLGSYGPYSVTVTPG